MNCKNKKIKYHFMTSILFLSILPSLAFAAANWTVKNNMPAAKYGMSASVVNGKIYVFGGRAGGQFFSTVEVYDPATDEWTRKKDMPTGRVGLSTSVVDGKIYVIGGNRFAYGPTAIVEEYDPVTDTWARKADMSMEWSTSTSVVNGKIYAIGGTPRGVAWGVSWVEEYDPATNTWTRKADMPTPRSCSTSAVNGKIYAIGGIGPHPDIVDPGPAGAIILSTVEEYDPVTDTWTQKADMPTPRGCSTSAVNGKIYAFGGRGSNDDILSTVEEYDPETDTWTKKPDMPTPRIRFSTSAVDGKIYAIGGWLDPFPRVTGAVEAFQAAPLGFAVNPAPPDGALLFDTWVTLRWLVGDFAVSHDVYFIDNFDDVNDGTESAFRGNQAENFFAAGFQGFLYPDGLVPGTTYYWRIDEVNDTDPNSPWKGEVWSFSIIPETAYDPDPPDAAQILHANVDLSWKAGLGAKLHIVYFGDNFDDVNNSSGGMYQTAATFTPAQLEPEKTYYWRVDESDGINTYKGDIWSFKTADIILVNN